MPSCAAVARLPDEKGDTPLHLAAARGHVALARLLLDAGALPSAIDGNGATALQLATTPQMQMLLRAADAGEALPPRLEGEEEDDDEDDADGDTPQSGRGSSADAEEGVLAPSKPNGGGAKQQGGSKGAVPFGPPPHPRNTLGDPELLPAQLPGPALIRELQKLLNSRETDIKRLLVMPMGLKHEVQCDVVRVGKGNTYRCYLRLFGSNDRRVCVFEATRTRKGKLKNSQYRIMLPANDPRMVPPEYGPVSEMSEEALDAALYCGKVRSYNLSGANFVAYDDGVKPEAMPKGAETRPRAQMVRACSARPRRVCRACAGRCCVWLSLAVSLSLFVCSRCAGVCFAAGASAA
jgi:hypothetical protein